MRARRNPATPVDRRDQESPNYYLDWAFDEMKKLVDTFPKSMVERVFVVRTALDLGVQHAAEEAVENQLRQYGQEYHAKQAAAVVADLDGGVRAMVGGRDYGASQFNRAVDAMRQRMNEEWLDSFGLLSLPIAEMNPDKTKIIGRIVQDAILNLMHNIPVSGRYREAHTPLYSA